MRAGKCRVSRAHHRSGHAPERGSSQCGQTSCPAVNLLPDAQATVFPDASSLDAAGKELQAHLRRSIAACTKLEEVGHADCALNAQAHNVSVKVMLSSQEHLRCLHQGRSGKWLLAEVLCAHCLLNSQLTSHSHVHMRCSHKLEAESGCWAEGEPLMLCRSPVFAHQVLLVVRTDVSVMDPAVVVTAMGAAADLWDVQARGEGQSELQAAQQQQQRQQQQRRGQGQGKPAGQAQVDAAMASLLMRLAADTDKVRTVAETKAVGPQVRRSAKDL